jgi:hypothetical protein
LAVPAPDQAFNFDLWVAQTRAAPIVTASRNCAGITGVLTGEVKTRPVQKVQRFKDHGSEPFQQFQPFDTVFATYSGRTEFFYWGQFKSLPD